MAGSRRTRRRRSSTVLRLTSVTTALLLLVLVALRLLPGSPLAHNAAAKWGLAPTPTVRQDNPDDRTASPAPTLPPLPVAPVDVEVDATGWWSWALMDTRTGEISGSANKDETNNTASLIKAWIAADFLRLSAANGETPNDSRMHQLSIMIRDSDNDAATSLFRAVDRTDSIKRMIRICKLTDSSPAADGGWSTTALSPEDAVRMGACIADGRAAGPKWTDWLLDEMRAVRGVGNFGIRKAFPTDEQRNIAIKNGWVDRVETKKFEVNCLAIGDGWALSVMSRYSINLGYTYGAETCQDVAAQLIRID